MKNVYKYAPQEFYDNFNIDQQAMSDLEFWKNYFSGWFKIIFKR